MNFVKIIYFDEGTAADYMQITSGGELKKTTEFVTNVSGETGLDVDLDVNVGKKKSGVSSLFKALTGFGIDASIHGNADVEAKKDKIAKTILENTLLADFVDLIDTDSRKKKESSKNHTAIKQFKNMQLYPQVNSFSYFMLMAPFFTMINGQMPIDFDEGQVFNLDITKIEEAISRGRGFYEFIAIDENDHKEKIFRFSSVAFRNNYTMSDIAKMQLSLYAVHVGSIDKNKLDISREFEFNAISKDRIEYDEKVEEKATREIDVFDVILAGIAS